MTECRSPELQDLLPDYAAQALDEVTMTRIESHLADCVGCADDLAVLQLVRQSRPRVAVPDIARIVAALPPSPAGRRPNADVGVGHLRLVRDSAEGARPSAGKPSSAGLTTPPSMTSPPKRGAVFGMSLWRLAATLGVVIAGGASVLVARNGLIDTVDPTTAVAVQGGDGLVNTPAIVAPERAETVAVAAPNRAEPVSVSYGDLGDYSEDELQNMLDRLERWDGATSTEPLPGVPILLASGGSTP
ncbi:zf-HC2 domain-containing protein [Gemmatimonas sp.]